MNADQLPQEEVEPRAITPRAPDGTGKCRFFSHLEWKTFIGVSACRSRLLPSIRLVL